jgi:hypothetical protein
MHSLRLKVTTPEPGPEATVKSIKGNRRPVIGWQTDHNRVYTLESAVSSLLRPMSSSFFRLSRLHHATRYSSMPFLYPCIATSTVPPIRAMMSAIRSGSDHQLHPPLTNSPPTVIPSSPSLSPDAAAPQIAARPPPAPKVEKPRPKIRSSKAALTIVRLGLIPITCSI